jgi:hypothetical protein
MKRLQKYIKNKDTNAKRIANMKKIEDKKFAKRVAEKKRRDKFTKDVKKIAEMKPDTRPSTRAYATPMDNKKRKYKGKHSTSKAGNQWIIYN